MVIYSRAFKKQILCEVTILLCLCVSRSVMSDSLPPHGTCPRLLCPQDSPGKNTGVGSHSLLQEYSQPRYWPQSPALQADSLPSEPPGKPNSSPGLVAKSYLTLVIPWTVAHQAPLSMEFSRLEYWSGLTFPSPGILL